MKFRILFNGKRYVPQVSEITLSFDYNGQRIEKDVWEDIAPYYPFETEDEARLACDEYGHNPYAGYTVVAEFDSEEDQL